MACPGDVDVRYSIHSRLSVDVMLTGNLVGMLEPQNRATIIIASLAALCVLAVLRLSVCPFVFPSEIK